MSDQSANNKRIAKNTAFLYMRMLITMAIGLFTSRIVLRTLGVEDYGIYNIVGGVVVLFNFVNQSLLSGTQRFLSYELGKEQPDVKTVFSACAKMHIGLSVIFFIVAETIGLWFVNTQLNIPEARMIAANWAYQFSVLGCIVQIIRCPYNAAIISYERMSIYAYISIVEAILKLVTAYLLLVVVFDKLILYSIFTFVVLTIVSLIYIIYCHKLLSDVRIIKVKKNPYYKEIFNFSKWTIFGSLANMGKEQGLNLIVNLFYGVTLNAAVGIANQVNIHISEFVSNFQVALNPQLTKSEVGGNRERQYGLIYKSAKFSYFIMLFLSVPIILNLDYLLTLWLGEYPPHTTSICLFIILGVLIETLSGPLWVSIFATGKVRTYQIVISAILLMNIPLAFIVGKLGLPPAGIYAIRAFIYIAALTTRLIFLKRLIGLEFTKFATNVIAPVLLVSIPLFALIFVKQQFVLDTTFVSFLVESILVVLIETVFIGWLGLNKNERDFITQTIFKKIKK